MAAPMAPGWSRPIVDFRGAGTSATLPAPPGPAPPGSVRQAAERVVPVRRPRLPAVVGEGLIPFRTVGRRVGPLEPDLDRSTVQLVVAVEVPDAVGEPADHRRVEPTRVPARRPPDPPYLLVRVEQPQGHPLVRLPVRRHRLDQH